MEVKGRIYIEDEYPSLIAKAIDPDNLPTIERRLSDKGIEISVDSLSIGSLLLTMDDLLINIKIIMDIYNILNTNVK